jgi:hypothetical protein
MYVELGRMDSMNTIPFNERRQVIHSPSRSTLHRGHGHTRCKVRLLVSPLTFEVKIADPDRGCAQMTALISRVCA